LFALTRSGRLTLRHAQAVRQRIARIKGAASSS
jgi:hypothetical protein